MPSPNISPLPYLFNRIIVQLKYCYDYDVYIIKFMTHRYDHNICNQQKFAKVIDHVTSDMLSLKHGSSYIE